MARSEQDSEVLFRYLVQSAKDRAIFGMDLEGRITRWNPGAERIEGWREEEILGQHVRVLFPEEDRRAKRPEQELQEALENERYAGEEQRQRKDGSRFEAEVDLWLLRDDAGRPRGFVTVIRDLTERKRAEAALEERERLLVEAEAAQAQLEAIFRSLPDAVYVGGPEGIQRANAPALAQLGYDTVEELNRNIATLAEEIQTRRLDTGAFIPAEEQAFSHALRGQADMQDVRVRHRKTGEERVVRSFCAPIRVGGKVTGAVAINVDITERTRAEEALRARADFEQQLIGIVSHDLRNPLHAILLGAATLLHRNGHDERTLKALLRIQSSAERATRLVKDLLDFTQARLGGGIRTQPQDADLHAITRHAVEEVQVTWPERTLTLRQEGDGRGRWDPDRLAQVVQNLATNAVKYSPPDTPVTVTTRGEVRGVVLEVHNAGTPIAPELLGRLFEPLQRGAGARSAADRSVGLGLFIVQHLVRAHGGTIDVRSRAEEGTTFTVRLPRGAPAAG